MNKIKIRGEIQKLIGESWEQTSKELSILDPNHNGINPHAYSTGFVDAYCLMKEENKQVALGFWKFIKQGRYWFDDLDNVWRQSENKDFIGLSDDEFYDLYLQPKEIKDTG